MKSNTKISPQSSPALSRENQSSHINSPPSLDRLLQQSHLPPSPTVNPSLLSGHQSPPFKASRQTSLEISGIALSDALGQPKLKRPSQSKKSSTRNFTKRLRQPSPATNQLPNTNISSTPLIGQSSSLENVPGSTIYQSSTDQVSSYSIYLNSKPHR